MAEILNILFGTATLAAMVRLSTPLVLASMGGAFGNKSGVFNIALESFMLTSAFFAMYGSYLKMCIRDRGKAFIYFRRTNFRNRRFSNLQR